MTTRLRIDLAGYHHIINYGVNRMNIFRHNEDKEVKIFQLLWELSMLIMLNISTKRQNEQVTYGKGVIVQDILSTIQSK